MNLSKTALSILQTRIGYRNDELYNSKVVRFEDILCYEVKELGNLDILETCKSLYNVKISCDDIDKSIQSVLYYFCEKLKSDILFAKWLTTKKNVNKLYEGNAKGYNIPDFSFIASDLGDDGILFVSNTEFIRIERGVNNGKNNE